MLDVLLTFDVEDVYFDPSEGGDDHPIWMARVLDSLALKGTFLYVGDKVRRLKKNGRRDVVEAMANHSIGLHVNSNRHPTMQEYTAGVDWFVGLERVRADEESFAEAFEAFFGRPPEATSRHSCLGATQQYAVAAEMKLPSIYAIPASIPSISDISFCCGALTTPCGGGPGYIGTGFDRAYSDDARTDLCIEQLDQKIDQCRTSGRTFLNVFLGHPIMVRGESPWFIYFLWPNGRNLSIEEANALGRAPIKPASVMPAVKRNFRRLCEHIVKHPQVNVIGADELQRRYGWHKKLIAREDLCGYIDRLFESRGTNPVNYMGQIVLDEWFAPAEILAALADSVVAWSQEGNLPPTVARRDVLGPLTVPLICPETAGLTAEQLVSAAREIQKEIETTPYLPGNVVSDGRRVGLGSFLVGLSDFYRRIAAGGEVAGVELPRVTPRYPAVAHEIDALWRQIVLEDGVTDPEVDLELPCRYARLQSWTIRKAHRKDFGDLTDVPR